MIFRCLDRENSPQNPQGEAIPHSVRRGRGFWRWCYNPSWCDIWVGASLVPMNAPFFVLSSRWRCCFWVKQLECGRYITWKVSGIHMKKPFFWETLSQGSTPAVISAQYRITAAFLWWCWLDSDRFRECHWASFSLWCHISPDMWYCESRKLAIGGHKTKL